MKMMMSRIKSISFSQLTTVVLLLVLIGVTLGIGAFILQEVNTTAGFTAGSVPATTIGNATDALQTISEWLPIIALVIAAGVVIGVLVTAFSTRRGV